MAAHQPALGAESQGRGKAMVMLSLIEATQGLTSGFRHPTAFQRKPFLHSPTDAGGEEKRKLQSQLENLPTLSLVLKKCKGDELGKLVDVKLYPSE